MWIICANLAKNLDGRVEASVRLIIDICTNIFINNKNDYI